MPNPSELERQNQLRADLQMRCMVDFYVQQTEEPDPTAEEVEQYFEKLTNAQIDEDILCYAIFEKQYMQEAMQHV